MFDDDLVESFVRDGFVRLEQVFPADVAAGCRDILWQEIGADPNDRSTWTTPVVRLGNYGQPPFQAVVNAPRLHEALDVLVGKGRWKPLDELGMFPVRFPSEKSPGDDGWHVEASFPGDDFFNFTKWRTSVSSKGRTLLMLILLSDVGENDAPTRIRVGSHLAVPPLLEPAGDEGMDFMELMGRAVPVTEQCPVAFATGRAGDVYLCHPFIVHAAQAHHGVEPKFMAHSTLHPSDGEPVSLDRPDGAYSPVEVAIRRGLGL